MALITPERLLSRASCSEPRDLAIRMHKKLQIELDPEAETSKHYLDNLGPDFFELSFRDESSAQAIFKQVQSRVEKLLEKLDKEQTFRLLPPLFVLSNEKFIIIYDEVFLVATEEGPIVPVVDLESVCSQSILQTLITIYELESPYFVNMDALQSMLPVEQEEVFADHFQQQLHI